MIVLLWIATAAAATPLSAGELENTGHTLPAGAHRIGLLLRYAHGLTPRLEVGTRALGWVSEANLRAKYTLLQRDRLSVAGDVMASAYWSGGYGVGLWPSLTLGGAETSRVNIAAGYAHTQTEAGRSQRVPVRVSVDVVTRPEVVWRVFGLTDAAQGTLNWTAGAAWYRGGERLRVGLGVFASSVGLRDLGDITEQVELGFVGTPPMVLPYAQLWWRL